MPTPNYAFEKRQRELAKKRKKEEKLLRKTHKPGEDTGAGQDGAADEGGVQGVQSEPAKPDPSAPR